MSARKESNTVFYRLAARAAGRVFSNWRDNAACREIDPDLFFPIEAEGHDLLRIDEAKRICRACPVRAQCLAWALDHWVDHGVWGGATADELRAIRKWSRET
jgi:WhiB family transcriptional regulator, redox-sensing transcriptional regulator